MIEKLVYDRVLEELERRRLQNRRYDWSRQARPAQLPPEGDWYIWCIIAGRGFGKTRAGAEAIRMWVKEGQAKRIALVGKTMEDVRKVMVEGESGLLQIHPPGEVSYYPGLNSVRWKEAVATGYSADAYEGLRGPQFDTAWVDELAKFQNPTAVFDQLMMSMRLGKRPRVIITTTPRPIQIIKDLIAREDVVVTQGSTYENSALSEAYIKQIRRSYEGTRFGKQEIEGQLLTPQSLWKREMIRVWKGELPQMRHILVGLDPAATSYGDETGIVTVGESLDGRFFILDDASGRLTPAGWAEAVRVQCRLYETSLVVAESNQGGEMIQSILPGLRLALVHATKSKAVRALPIAALYEREEVFHARHFPELEKQLLEFETCKSPDRVDALVWAINFLRTQKRSLWVGPSRV